jgi:MFS family permease
MRGLGRCWANQRSGNSEEDLRSALELLRREPRARLFFATLAQSAIGTGAGYVALLLVAYDRFRSPWAITLVLLAELVPAMLLGPALGALVDRFSRRASLVAADLLRGLAFAGIVLVDSFEATVAFALVAGAGTALFTPASLAALPSLVAPRRRPPATALYGAINDLGFTAGPALAAVVLAAGGATAILIANAVTFAVSAVVLSRLAFGPRAWVDEDDLEGSTGSITRRTREGLRAAAATAGVRAVLLATASALFIAGVFNVAELLLATDELGAGDAGYSVLVAILGVGFVAGSLSGSNARSLLAMKRGYLLGLLLIPLGLVVCGAAPILPLAAVGFAVVGAGNGATLVHGRLLIQETVPDHLLGRVFGIKDSLTAWAFALAFACAGGLISGLGVRTMLVLSGVAGVALWLATRLALRGLWDDAAALGDVGADGRDRAGGADDAERVQRRAGRFAPLDDADESRDHPGIELSPGVRG